MRFFYEKIIKIYLKENNKVYNVQRNEIGN